MKVLDKHFEWVVFMTLDPESEKAASSIKDLSKHTDNLRVVKGIRGDEIYPASWWRAGNGAWGCLQTHIRIAQDAWSSGVKNYIVFEDDAKCVEDFETRLEEFMESLPENWDQVYLGGQHRATPRWVNARVYQPRRVNRTHCFALTRDAIPEFLNHVTDYADHINAGYPKHIDHRLEDAHRSRRWNVYSPSWWLVGQRENWSDINGRHHPDKWWDHSEGQVDSLPYVYCDRPPTEEEKKFLHFGWAERPEGTLMDPYFLGNPDDPRSGMYTIADEAYSCRRLPAVAWYEQPSLDNTKFMEAWKNQKRLGGIADLEKFADYPQNDYFQHRWVAPRDKA